MIEVCPRLSLWTTRTALSADCGRLDGMTEMDLPGFDTVELLGYGSGGEVWLARERATGLLVALKRLRPGADLAARDRLRREAAVLAGVVHPHVIRLRAVHGDGEALVLVLDLAARGSLSRLLATRRRLPAAEVVTIAVPLAQALAEVHSQGLVHGDVTPGNVLFAADGRPMLGDLGISRLLGSPPAEVGGTGGFLDPAEVAAGAPGPASDVHGLAATCLAALTGLPPYDDRGARQRPPAGTSSALAEILEQALAPDPADRPTAEAFALAVFDSGPAEPVGFDSAAGSPAPVPGAADAAVAVPPTHQAAARGRSDEPAVVPAPRTRRRRSPSRPGRLVVGAVAAVLVLALAVTAGVAWSAADDVPPAAGRSDQARAAPGTPPSGWARTLAVLDADRSRAFAAGDPGRLRKVYAPDAPALRRDTVALRRLSAAGLRAQGLRMAATSVDLAGRSAGRVRLAVTDVMPAYRLVDHGGTVVEHRPGRGARSWLVVLARDGERWRVYDVERG
jgi:hypothetical protein